MADQSSFEGIPAYLAALWANWPTVAIGSAISAGIEFVGAHPNSFPACLRSFADWLHRSRHYVAVTSFILAFILANFFAFDYERQRAISAEKNYDTGGEIKTLHAEIAGLTAHRWEPLSDEERGRLIIALRNIPKPVGVPILCSSADCMDLAYSLRAVFEFLGWETDVEAGIQLGPMKDPIEVWSGNPHSQEIIDALSTATRGRLTASNHIRNEGRPSDQIIDIGIGRKP